MKGSPEWPAVCHWEAQKNAVNDEFSKVISPQPNPKVAPSSGHVRNDKTSGVRLIQVDWAVTDEASPIGWVFGTFMYNGHLEDKFPNNVRGPTHLLSFDADGVAIFDSPGIA